MEGQALEMGERMGEEGDQGPHLHLEDAAAGGAAREAAQEMEVEAPEVEIREAEEEAELVVAKEEVQQEEEEEDEEVEEEEEEEAAGEQEPMELATQMRLATRTRMLRICLAMLPMTTARRGNRQQEGSMRNSWRCSRLALEKAGKQEEVEEMTRLTTMHTAMTKS